MDSALLDVVNSSEAITKPTDGPEWVDGIRVSAHPLTRTALCICVTIGMNCLLVSIRSLPNSLQRNEFGGRAMSWMAPVGGDRPS